ncbi:MAG: ubiquitin-like small modifier protein 2 [Haloarculaceae archaeon]
MQVRVDVVNGETRETELDDGATYADVLDVAGFGPHEATVLVDGSPVPEDAPVTASEVRVLRLVQGG